MEGGRGPVQLGGAMYRVLLVEDEEHAATVLSDCVMRYAESRGEDLRVSWIRSALEFSAESHPADIIFMDIDLPGINGMEAAELLRTYDEETPLVFVTNLAQYAVKGYEVDALDFIVKPVRYNDLVMTLDRVLRRLRRTLGRTTAVQTHDGVRVVSLSDIVYVEALNHNLAFHLVDGSELVSRATLSGLEEGLESSSFLRVSKSCIVNLEHIRLISGDELKLTGGDSVWVSRSRRKVVLSTVADFLGGSI